MSDYASTLKAARKVGAARADDTQLMALFCAGPLRLLCGAVSPQLVWEGAVARGLDSRALTRLVYTDVRAVSDLQWEEPK